MTINFPNNVEEAELLSNSKPVTLQHREGSIYRDVVKPLFDAGFVLATALFVAPVILIMALLVSLDGNTPFYHQKRVGKNGRIFKMWKLRTMVPDADELLEKYLASNPEARAEWNASQKLKKDPRITRMGAILRKTSLDELPQVWNVLRGEMSLVGPRPMMCSQQELYPGSAYYKLRPGITGNWQVSDRNDSEFKSRAEYDAVYDRDVSFRLDLWIIACTVAVVMRGTGY
ncbi:sugar transferase [Actibacterium lipolyticum]|uniref:Undecaprenyl phosphate N,N'-diacetylbacillosamine 1-phosphate transferase n=1 Tax=Actibacterium lipolyticum TaxID=1524263 RepID=A0A238KUE5_9RHOB|nr:sugar transferase [Actibacterium lipolyticum]SMX46453.1 Undecaprenyl phosphate N,N'-diacetylbacillosamine 1-phosphate transferase [Actibacterium lipolyticum]